MSEKPSLKKSAVVPRRSVRVSGKELVKTSFFGAEDSLPLVVEPLVEDLDLSAYANNNWGELEAILYHHGAILFRGFKMRHARDLEALIAEVCGNSLDYVDQTSPRHKISGGIYTSTDYPAEQAIFLHNENSYSSAWPMKIFFFCLIPATQGGETPIADVRRVLKWIPPDIKASFQQKGWALVRNFGDGFGLPWQAAFQTSKKSQVEEYCRAAGIRYEWKGDNRLRTFAARAAIMKHPRTGQEVWFNHATFFHISTLAPTIREALLTEFRREDLPYNTYYGDGTELEPAVLECLRDAYRAESASFRWEKGDVLMVDNMLVAHGRMPFSGPRKVLVGMADLFDSRKDLSIQEEHAKEDH